MRFIGNKQSTTTRSPPEPRARVRGWLVAAALVATAPATAIEPFTADYQANYMGMQGQGQMRLVPEGEGRWRYTLDINSSLAKLKQSTVFEEHKGNWRPLSGDDSTSLFVKNSRKAANYDWGSGNATWTGDVKPERAGPVQLQNGDMDALLINLALVRDVAAGKPLRYRLVDNGRTKQLDYKIAGTEKIDVGGTPRQATRVVNTDGDKQTIAWVVEGMPVPARILQREDGKDALDLRVKAVR
ncbi:MAG: DUF3108 domain-containing protein [Pseudomonadota bacterium]|nr:DUF3108 domain-containing protein [Pseudomonadota bacterium]